MDVSSLRNLNGGASVWKLYDKAASYGMAEAHSLQQGRYWEGVVHISRSARHDTFAVRVDIVMVKVRRSGKQAKIDEMQIHKKVRPFLIDPFHTIPILYGATIFSQSLRRNNGHSHVHYYTW